MGNKQRQGRAWKAPSLSFCLKITMGASALSLSLRIITVLHHRQSTATIMQQLLDEFLISPTEGPQQHQQTRASNSKSRSSDVLSDRHFLQKPAPSSKQAKHDAAMMKKMMMNHPAMTCICQNTEYDPENNSTQSRVVNRTACLEQIHLSNTLLPSNDNSSSSSSSSTTIWWNQPEHIWNRDPRRIPTYLQECPQSTFFGFVFRDFVNRMFPRIPDLFQSHYPNRRKRTVIVSNDAVRAASLWENKMMDSGDMHVQKMQKEYGYNVPVSIYLAAKDRGYKVSAVSSMETGANLTTIVTNGSGGDDDVSELLLLFFDPSDMSQQDNLITRSTNFLEQEHPSTYIDYVVFRMVISSDAISYGKDAALQLLDLGYRLQILSASHAVSPQSYVHSQPETISNPYGPNKVFATKEEFILYCRHFMTWVDAEPNPLLDDHHPHDAKNTTATRRKRKRVYSVYLFATTSSTPMEMAIPSAQEYINLTGVETADVVLNVDGDGIPYRGCSETVARLVWTMTTTTIRETTVVRPVINGINATTKDISATTDRSLSLQQRQGEGRGEVDTLCVYNRPPRELWFSGPTPESSEMACLDCPPPLPVHLTNKKKQLESTTCITRFLPLSNVETKKATSKNFTLKKTKPNILFILLQQVSRDRFEKFMPMTRAAIVAGGLTRMDHYTATSTIPHEQLQIIVSGGTTARQSIQSLLDQAGYATFSGGNGCNATVLENTPDAALQYGSQLNKMLCRQPPSQPNCIGEMPAVQHLLDYSSAFLKYHLKQNKTWAAFLSFVEGRDETGILPGTIDKRLSQFITQIHQNFTTGNQWNNTLIVFASDTGATHGSFSQSFAGMQEMVQPVLYLKGSSMEAQSSVEGNRNGYSTPYDLHRTIEAVISDTKQTKADSFNGNPLISPLPDIRLHCENVDMIPQSFCTLLNASQTAALQKEVSVQSSPPPSVLSFYADMPKQRRAHIQIKTKQVLRTRANVTKGCYCATNIARWYPCEKHPFSLEANSPTFYKEFFLLVECPGLPTHLQLRMTKNYVLTKRSDSRLPKSSKPLPNIIFLELDSVSGAFADRHFPKTREFLQRFRVHQTSNGTYECLDGVCSADFTERVSLAGANSIPNQVAALSGCLSSDFDHACGHEEPDVNLYCEDPTEPHYGLQIHRVRTSAKQIYWCPPQIGRQQRFTPWMFSLTDSLGYLNFFGEEFCYEGSPYVTQGNVFPSFFSDISPHLVFCRLAEQRIRRENHDPPVSDKHRWAYENQDQACVDSDASDCAFEKARISLELMKKMWNVYPDRPKFAFLNVLAAHVYNADWSKVFLAAERYDEHLCSFLETMVMREDLQNTVIVIRSDHGLQRGPTAINYNLQVEHTRPWTEILVPESIPLLSKKTLFENQNRLTSGYDLYHTLRSRMQVGNLSEEQAPLSNWTYDLLSMPVPSERTCKEARVDEELCRERSIIPSFGICNVLDSHQQQTKFCRNYEVQPVVAEKNTSTQYFHSVACNNDILLDINVTESWNIIDDILAKDYPHDRVSGGIFLYPRQASLLTTLVQGIASRLDRQVTLCETGFGSGHSLALFAHAVAQSPHPLHILSFDKFDRNYQLPIWKRLSETYPFTHHHLDYVAGDSCKTVPATLTGSVGRPPPIQCDILHGSSLCGTDNIDLVEHAPCGALLTSTAMGSLNDTAVYFGPKAQWRKLRARGCITPPICFQEDILQLNRTLVFAKEGSSHTHQFCIATTTGACRPPGTTATTPPIDDENCSTDLYEVVSQLGLRHFCRRFQIPPPL